MNWAKASLKVFSASLARDAACDGFASFMLGFSVFILHLFMMRMAKAFNTPHSKKQALCPFWRVTGPGFGHNFFFN
jgi:hypothetical protein